MKKSKKYNKSGDNSELSFDEMKQVVNGTSDAKTLAKAFDNMWYPVVDKSKDNTQFDGAAFYGHKKTPDNMTKVKEVIERFTISPRRDIEPYLKLTKKLSINRGENGGCYNCGDTLNQVILESEPWTIVEYCWKCNHINVVYVSDSMGGCGLDTIECYTDK